jgi:hypothetical protein
MEILAQNYKSGELQMIKVPNPLRKKEMLIVETIAFLVSMGTEKAMMDIAKKSLLGIALARA